MNELTLAAQADAWRGALLRTASACATYYARRAPHWIAIGARIWAEQAEFSPLVGHSLSEELMRSAQREVELRGEFTRRMLGELAERSREIPASRVLVDCTKLASELVRDGCRDLENDIVRASRFLHGVDSSTVSRTVASEISRITDHLLELTDARRDTL